MKMATAFARTILNDEDMTGFDAVMWFVYSFANLAALAGAGLLASRGQYDRAACFLIVAHMVTSARREIDKKARRLGQAP